MRVLIWNIRGFGRRGHQNQLRDYLRSNKVDILFLQETIRQDFSLGELDSLEVGDKFFWSWLPTNGHSGGLLAGFRDSVFEVGSVSKGEFLLTAQGLRESFSFPL
jgi:exonuclease III